jgi:rod shape-determining protein MreC
VAERSGLDVQLAPILDIDLDPVKQRLVLDAGSREGVHVGQAVIDAGGLMGQVISVTGGTSTVLLLTDPDHAVPVTVARNGVRLIVYGRGDTLELRDIRSARAWKWAMRSSPPASAGASRPASRSAPSPACARTTPMPSWSAN